MTKRVNETERLDGGGLEDIHQQQDKLCKGLNDLLTRLVRCNERTIVLRWLFRIVLAPVMPVLKIVIFLLVFVLSIPTSLLSIVATLLSLIAMLQSGLSPTDVRAVQVEGVPPRQYMTHAGRRR